MEEEFKTDGNLKPDVSDRPIVRERKIQSSRSLGISRQQIMMGVGVLVLLVLIIVIGLTPTPKVKNEVKGVDLPGHLAESHVVAESTIDKSTQIGQPQQVTVPEISTTPTQSLPIPQRHEKQRVELPGNVLDALIKQQKEVAGISQVELPTTSATVISSSEPRKASNANEEKAHSLPNKTKVATIQTGNRHVSSNTLNNVPADHYTLQLGSASRSDTLSAFAKKQRLSDYWVYETIRSGKPLYVLVSGSYSSVATAKHAISMLPTEVKAQKPWVRSIGQVQKEIKKHK